ncbi:D-glycerate 3-kinase, chloroplastic-like isoform X4 [Miscanthus floridulus]|uniref:D-glycerate 3-kinase, chloroplastic-like isoform X4 n=1 Tax=Miscanthus floridulus TaxID=154761 RepID=UPI003457BBE1
MDAFLPCPDDGPTASPPPRAAASSSPSPALSASERDLYDFIFSGPLVDRIGHTKEKVAGSIDWWLRCGVQVARLLRLDERRLSEAEKARVYQFYIPVFLWCEDQVVEHRAKYDDGDDIPPLVIGVSAPQGSGKTTLVSALDHLFQVAGRKSATLSIDDFYLTAKEQNELRDRYPGNALLELRGNAGSHDLQFSVETLESLMKLTKEGIKMKVPRYDKSAFGGRGDRADPSVWPEVVLFEGWMLGFKPLPNEVVKAVDPQLEVVNKNLEAYYDAWDRFIKSWIVIKIREPSCVYQWRLQAEIAMKADGKPGMSDEEVMDFVSRYLPAYHAYLPKLYKEGPNGSKPDHLLVIDIDEGRNPICG